MSDQLKKQYQKMYNEMAKYDSVGDYQFAHGVQDNIYRKFIIDIVNNNIKLEEVISFANDINEYVIKQAEIRWYA